MLHANLPRTDECSMSRHTKYAFASVVLTLFGVVCCSTNSAIAADRPNIVFILTDDQAATAAGFAGNDEISTPHLDRLATEGAVLTRSFCVTPVCSPSRASLVTSRYGSELGIIDWINPREEPTHGLAPETVTWMELLQEAGYATGLFGKWHLGTEDRFDPTQMGYDTFVGIREGGCAVIDPMFFVDGVETQMEGYTVDLVTDYALEFIEIHQDATFCVSLHFREPHSAWLPVRDEDWATVENLDPTPPEPDFPNLDTPKLKQWLREYYASTTAVDRNVGRVLEALDQLEISDNTLVIFTSDHGYHHGHHGLWFKGNAHWITDPIPEPQWDDIDRRRRPNLYDQALLTPTLVRWPGVVAAGSTIDATVTHLDWYPTLIEAAGVELPDGLSLRGDSLVPLLNGREWTRSNDVYAEYSMRHGATVDMRCWRTEEWKLIVDFHHPDRSELYHLTIDPEEHENLIDSEDPDVLAARAALEERLHSHMADIDDFAQ